MSSIGLNNGNAPAFTSRSRLSPDVHPDMPPEPSADAVGQGRPIASLDDVTDGLGLPSDDRARLRTGLEEAGRGPDAIRKAVAGPLRELRQSSRDPLLVKTVGQRFTAYLGNGLIKGNDQPPAGFTPIPNSRHGGWHKQAGAGFLYYYPGVGVTRQSKENMPAQPGMKQTGPQQGPGGQQGQPRGGKGQPAGQQGAQAGQEQVDPYKPTSTKRPVAELLGGMDPKEFSGLSRTDQAAKTAKYSDVAAEMEQYQPPEPYDGDSHAGAAKSAAKHVRQLQRDGVFCQDAAERTNALVARMAQDAQAAKIPSQLFAALTARNVAKLALQEAKAVERTIGDHGVRHCSVNVKHCHEIMDALKAGGLAVEPKDYLAASQIMIDHDMGYAIPAIHEGGFDVGDKFHPQASRVLWEQQPEMGHIFGEDGAKAMAQIIEEHSGTSLDWEKDPLGSAVRMADNTHLFADKMPELLFDSRKGVELMAKIALLKQAEGFVGKEGQKAAGKDAGIGAAVNDLRDALRQHIDQRGDLPIQYRQRLQKAAAEIGANTDVFLASRLAGRDPKFAFDAKEKRMDLTCEHSDVRGAIADVFGEDEQDKQFSKMLEDFGLKKADQDKLKSPPPPTRVDIPPDGKGSVASFTWKPNTKANAHEKEFADVLHSVQAEWKAIQGEQDETKKAGMLAKWTGELTKALRAWQR